jgi:hypothetical protein
MARKAWVLDTETKGTGAEMVPLEKVRQRRRSAQKGAEAAERRRARQRFRKRVPEPEPERPRRPRRFKVVDVLSREALAEDVGIRETLDLLAKSRSVVDLIVYVWDREEQGWRPLTMREQKLLWEQRVIRSPRPPGGSGARAARPG